MPLRLKFLLAYSRRKKFNTLHIINLGLKPITSVKNNTDDASKVLEKIRPNETDKIDSLIIADSEKQAKKF